MTPAAVEEQYGVPPERYRDLAALVGESSRQPARCPRRRRQDGGEVDQRSTATSPASSPTSTRSRARPATSLREHLDDVLRNRPLNQLVTRPRPGGRPRRPRAVRRGTARRSTRSSTAWSSGCCATGSSRPLTPVEDETAEAGFDLDGDVLASEDVAGWLADHAPAGATRRRPRQRQLGARDRGDATAPSRWPTEAGAAAYVDVTELDPEADAGGRRLARRPRPAQGAARRQGPAARARRARLDAGRAGHDDTALAAYLVRPDQRSYDLADLALRYLKRELRAETEATAARGCSSFDDGRRRRRRERRPDAARPGGARPRRRPRRGARRDAGGDRAAARRRAAAGARCSREMERAGIAVDSRAAGPRSRRDFAAEVSRAPQAAYEAIGGEQINLGSPKQLQVVLFDELGHAEDQADQDRLHHRRRRAERPLRQDRAPVPRALLRHRDAARLRVTVEGLLKSVADDGRIHTTYHQTIAATGRLSLDRPQPAEHPDPHRGGPPDPRGVRRRRRVTSR